MKKLIKALIGFAIVLCFQGNLFAQISYDLKFVEVTNDGVNSGSFDVTIQIKANNGTFGMGSSNLVFTYNTAGLSFDSLWTAHNFSGGFYPAMTVTEPAPGRVSVNIELGISPGTTVQQTFMDVVTIEFTIVDNSETSTLAWRTQSPNATHATNDNFTEISFGNLENMDIPLALSITDHKTRAIPSEYKLYPNFPNPFNPFTIFRFDIPRSGVRPVDTRLVIYNSLGQVSKTLFQDKLIPGNYEVQWDGISDFGNKAPSGIYFVLFRANEFSQTGKLILVK